MRYEPRQDVPTPYAKVRERPLAESIILTRYGRVKMGSAVVAPGCLSSSSPLLSPEDDFLATYDKVARIRRSLSGSITLVRHRLSGELFAMKTVCRDLPLCSENARNEIELMTELSRSIGGYDNVVQLADHLTLDSSTHIIVMEYVPGGDLLDLLQVNGPTPESKARIVFQGIVRGLTALHRKWICHLDLSLENILLSKDGAPKICDLGQARRFQLGEYFRGRKGSMRPGKLEYMAPEVYAGQCFKGPDADVWSLGVCLFCLLFACHPYRATSSGAVNHEHLLRDGPQALAHRWNLHPAVSDDAFDLLSAMLRPAATRITLADVAAHHWTNPLDT